MELSSSFFELSASRGATDQELFLLLHLPQDLVAERPQQLCGLAVVVFFFGTRKEFNQGRQLSPWGCVPQKCQSRQSNSILVPGFPSDRKRVLGALQCRRGFRMGFPGRGLVVLGRQRDWRGGRRLVGRLKHFAFYLQRALEALPLELGVT